MLAAPNAQWYNTDTSISIEPPIRLAQLEDRLIAAALANLELLRDYERDILAASTTASDSELTHSRSIYQHYQDWAMEAQRVDRARSVQGVTVDGVDRLDDAIGRVLARLTVTPEQIAKAKLQVREGQFVPAREMRDELHARLRA